MSGIGMLLVIGSVSFGNRCQALRGDEIGLLTVIVEASPLAINRFRPILILILFHHPVVIDMRNHLMTLRIEQCDGCRWTEDV